MTTWYCLELVVVEGAAQYYPSLGSVEYPSEDNAGYDLKVVVPVPSNSAAELVPLGVKGRMRKITQLSPGIELVSESHYFLEPRSSIYKTGFIMANGHGIIDKSYRGELKAPLVSVGSLPGKIEAGQRLFQITAPDLGYIKEVRYVEQLPETLRGEGGFGSTGTK